MTITQEQRDAIRYLVTYEIEEERLHLEEHLATMFDVDGDDMDDKELVEFCEQHKVEHIWLSLYKLSKI